MSNETTQNDNTAKITINRLDEIAHRPWDRFGYRVFTRDTNVEVFEGRYPSDVYNQDGIRKGLTKQYPADQFRIEAISFPTIEDYNEGNANNG